LLQSFKEFPQADYIFLERTYGDKLHDVVFNTVDVLSKWVKKHLYRKAGAANHSCL
jgi:hypothetical protein